MHLSIRWKLLLSISIPLLVTYTAMLLWDYDIGRQQAIGEMQAEVKGQAQTSANAINNRLEAFGYVTDGMAGFFGRGGTTVEIRQRLQQSAARPNPMAPVVRVYYLTADNQQRVITLRRGNGGGQISDEPLLPDSDDATLFAQVRTDQKPKWTSVHDEAGSGQPVGTYATPIVRNGTCREVVATDLAISELMHSFRAGRRMSSRFFEPTSRPGGNEPPRGGEGPPDFEPGGPSTEPSTGAAGFGSGGGPNREGRQRPIDETRRRAENWRDRNRGEPPTTEEALGNTRPPEPPDNRGGGPLDVPPGEEPAPTTSPLEPDANAIELIDRDGRPMGLHGTDRGTIRRSVLQWADEHQLVDFTQVFHAALDGQTGIARVPELADIADGFKKGETYWIALAPIKETGWVYSAAIPESQVLGTLVHRLQQRALFLAAGLVVILIVAVVVAFRLSRPIEHMAGAVRQLAQGNLDARVTGVKSHDELGQLARAFNLMTGQLKAHVKALTEQTAAREKTDSELRIARQIQTDLLPRTFPPFPDRSEFDLHAVNVPAAGVAGDFYDFFFVADDWLTICIADVSGKGVPAALLMAVTRTIVRNLALAGLPLQKIVERANEMLLADTNNNMFVTMILAQYHPSTGRLRYVNAGHPRPFIFHADGPVEAFGSVTSPLLGVCDVCEIGPIESAETTLEVGQTLLLYTDGVTEARDMHGRMLRDSGTKSLITKHENEDVARFCTSLVDEVDRFQDHRPADDITILALRRKQ